MKRTNRSFRFVMVLLLVLSLSFPMSFNAYAVDGAEGSPNISNVLDPNLGAPTAPETTTPGPISTTDPAITSEDATDADSVTSPDAIDETADMLKSLELPSDFDSLPDSIKDAIKEMQADMESKDVTALKAPHKSKLWIDSVEVVNGGEVQEQNRDSVTYDKAYDAWCTSKRNASMTDARVFHVFSLFFSPRDFNMRDFYEFDISKVDWNYGDKALSEWKQYTYIENEDGDVIDQGFIGDSVISVLHQAHYTNGNILVVTASVEFDEFYPEDWYSVNIPYDGYTAVKKQGFPIFAEDDQEMLGPHDLEMIYDFNSGSKPETRAATSDGLRTIASASIGLNLYDSFHTWQEICDYAKDLMKKSGKQKEINERYVSVESIAQSAEGRDIWNVVIAKDGKSVKQYLEHTKPMTETENGIEALIEQLNKGQEDSQVDEKGIQLSIPKIPIYFNNVHPDETPASDAIIELINAFIYEESLSYDTQTEAVHHEKTPGGYDGYTMEVAGKTKLVSFEVDEILDHFILVFNLTENPDGRDYLLRANGYGFDLNRDAAYQTQKESTALTTNLVKWDPLAMLEYHGYVDELLIEPCTGPHDPNYEYDLYAKKMMDQGNALGMAMIGNTAYSQYLVPAVDYTDGWDDGAPIYGPMFAMLYGTMGYTLEIPYSTEDSKDACYTAGLALVKDSLDNFEAYYINKLNYKLRGIHNLDSRSVDEYLTDPYTGEPVGRPRGDRPNFFPEYYVIPVDSINQKNPLEAYKSLEFLSRNGAEISRTTTDIPYGDTTLSADTTFVIDMNQANRGFVNSMLSDGYDASSFKDIYAELVISHPDMRNFDCITIWEDEYFKDKITDADDITKPGTSIGGDSLNVVIYNNNIDVVKLVNKLLDAGKTVYMLTNDSESGSKGDFVVLREDLNAAVGDLLVYGAPFSGSLVYAETLVESNIAVLGSSSHSKFILDMLGFEGDYNYPKDVNSVDKNTTNVLVGFNNSFDVTSLVSGSGIGFIGIGTSTMNAAEANNLLPGLDCYIPKSRTPETYREGLIKSDYSGNNLVTANYDQTDTAYVMNGTYITKVPYDGEALITVDTGDDFFKAGWYPHHDVLKGEMLAVSGFSGSNNDVPVTLFANNIFSKAHAQHTFNMFANAVFLTALDYGTEKPLIEASPSSQETLAPSVSVVLNFKADRGTISRADGENEITQSKYKITTYESEGLYGVADGWIDYTSTTSITLTTAGAFYLHAYAENTLGENVQRVFGPYNIGTSGGGSGSGGGGGSSKPATTTPPAITPPAVFTDISGHWAKASIVYVVDKKLFSGVSDTLFAPDATMTRGMLVTVLGRAYGLNTEPYNQKSVFTDVPLSAYYAPYVAWAYENKIASGMGDGLFAPDKPITRGEMATIITNYMKFIGKGTQSTASLNYTDAAEIDSWGLEGVQFVTANGLMTGTEGNRFDFDGLSTRAQVATVMERLLKLIGQ